MVQVPGIVVYMMGRDISYGSNLVPCIDAAAAEEEGARVYIIYTHKLLLGVIQRDSTRHAKDNHVMVDAISY